MSDVLPIVELLADAGTHAERADWLFCCPPSIIDREHVAIRRILQTAGLITGVSYVEAMLSKQKARRLPDGTTPQQIELQVQIAASDLRATARAEGARCQNLI